MHQCPICGEKTCITTYLFSNYQKLRCLTYDFTISINNEIMRKDERIKKKIFNIIFEKILREPFCESKERKEWFFFYDDTFPSKVGGQTNYVNIAKYMEIYPKNRTEKANRALLNMSIKHHPYDVIEWETSKNHRMLFFDTLDPLQEYEDTFNLLYEKEYIESISSNKIRISCKGKEIIKQIYL